MDESFVDKAVSHQVWPYELHLYFQHLNTCRSEMSRRVASVLTSLSLSVSLYCLQSLLFTPLSFSPDHFSLFLAPSPLSPLSISLSYSFKSTVSIVSLIFNLSVPPILHFCKSFAFNESGGSRRCLTQSASEVLHHRNWQHDSPIIACQRWFADAPSLFSPPTPPPPPRSPSLVLSLLPSSARGGWSSHKWC